LSYLVLARKWRPQTFEEVVGQRPITQALQNAIGTQRVAHAYLFAGPRGVGKTSVARILAKALNCQEGPTAHPCDHCSFCKEVREGISVDVLEIDGASNRGINEIRELRENVRYLPSKNKYKVYIIDEVHMLTPEAFNALLKTLEEPPPHVIFVFATTEPHKIPLTILSRCQRYDFKRIPLGSILEQLKKIAAQEGMEISDQSLHLIAREAEGSMRDAQSLLDQVISFSGQKVSDEEVIEVLGVVDRKILHEAIRALTDGDGGRLLQIVEEVHSFGYDLREFCEELARLGRDLLVLKVHPQASAQAARLIDLPEDEIRDLAKLTERLSLEEMHSLFRSLLAAHEETARSAFPRLVLEMTLTRLARRRPILSVEEVLERLRAMEERLLSVGAISSRSAMGQPATPPILQGRDEPDSRLTAGKEEPEKLAAANGNRAVGAAVEKAPEGLPGGLSEELNGVWKEFVNSAKKKKPPLASLLEHGYPLALGEDFLQIGYPEKSFYLERMEEADNRSLLTTLASEFFKRPMRVQVVGLNPDAVPRGNGLNSEGGRDRKKNSRDDQVDALNHPLVREAINIFGGRVVEIKNL
jgi:DNA polymerase-3 subunit gamma/tau